MKLHFHPKSAKHREEAAKLAATVLNGVAITCLIGAAFGPWLNPSMERGWNSLALFFSSGFFHVCAQFVLSMGYEDEP